MSALEEHAEANRGALAGLCERIGQSSVETIYYSYVSVGGRVLGKLAPASKLERNLTKGVQFHGAAIADFVTGRLGESFGAGAGGEEFVALPDPETFQVLPWDPTFGRFLCRLYRRGDRVSDHGQPLPTDPRGVLIRAHEAFQQSTKLQLRSGCEPEMTWLGEAIDVSVRPAMSPAYGLSALELMRPVVTKVMSYASAMGFDMIEGDYEDTGQLELNFAYDDCVATADRLITYRQICAQVAKELGVVATFMPKPALGLMANGCHHNLSLWSGERNVFEEPDRRELHISETAHHALAGLLRHAPGTMAIMASTVNSYARYWDEGYFAPARANWGFDNRTCAVRVSASGRLEFKVPDAMVNPYLSHTAILASMASGLADKADPGDPQQGSSYDDSTASHLPRTLGDALTAFAADSTIRGAFPAELSDLFIQLKRDEWERFLSSVTDWHREMYMEWLP